MEIIFKMTMDDYLELLRLKNNDISITRKAKIQYKISIAIIIVITTFFLLELVAPFYIPVLVMATILLIIWFLYSDSIFNTARDKTIKNLANKEFSKSIKQIKDTKITLQEDGISEEIEGMYSKIQWSFINDISVTKNNIFINLISGQVLNIPKRAFKNEEEEKKFLKYNESAYVGKNLPVVVFDFDQVVEIDARFTILKKYGFVGNVVEVATNNYEITKELIRMGYDISPYLGNHTWDYSTDEGIQNLTANIAEKLGGLETVGVYNPTMISCSGHKYSDTMEKILSSYKIDYVRCSGFIKDGVSLKKSMYENSYDTRIVVPISLGSYNGADEFNATIDSLVDGNVPLIMPFMHTFGYDADWITQEAFEKVVSHVSELVKNGKALCMNMHDFVAYNDAVKSIHDDYIRNMSAIFN